MTSFWERALFPRLTYVLFVICLFVFLFCFVSMADLYQFLAIAHPLTLNCINELIFNSTRSMLLLH